MADNIIGNMFGVDPDQLAQQRQQQIYAQSIQQAQLDPYQRASASLYQGGAGVGQIGAQMLGWKAPGQQLAESRKAALAGLDTTDPDSVTKAAQALNASGDTQGASMLAQHAQDLIAQKSALDAQQATTAYTKARTEELSKPSLGAEVAIKGLTPDGKQLYHQAGSEEGQYYYDDNGNRVKYGGKIVLASGQGKPKPLASDTASIAQQIAEYRLPPVSTRAQATPEGQALMAQVAALNPTYDATQYNTKKAGDVKFTSGQQGNSVRSIGVANTHLDTLNLLFQAQENGDITAFNKARNIWRQQTGSELPNDVNTAVKIVAPEVAKGIIGSGAGSMTEREALANSFASSASPDIMKGATKTVRALLKGQLNGLRGQYQASTGKKDFYNRFGLSQEGTFSNVSDNSSPNDLAAMAQAEIARRKQGK